MNLRKTGRKIQVLALSLLAAAPLQASWLTDGASAYKTVNEVRHWAAYLSAAIMIAVLKATWNMEPLQNKYASYARATALYAGTGLSGGFALHEFWPSIMSFAGWLFEIGKTIYNFVESLI